MRGLIVRFLARPTGVWVAVAVAVTLAAPSLTTGLSADDWLQHLVALGLRPFAGLPASRYDLFSFVGHDPRDTLRGIDAGELPWWTDPAVKLAFWRPLSSLTHVLDWTLWPDSPVAMHAQNLFWFALALIAVAIFYRRFFAAFAIGAAAWAGGLATLLYAIDDAHGPAVGWIANRNAMVAIAFALPVMVLHDRWRREGWRAGAWIAPLWLAVALGAGESSLAVAAYLFAYAVCLDERGTLGARLASLAPYIGVVIVWRVVYHALGYGTAWSGVYLDPGAEPGAFLHALPSRAFFLVAGQLFGPWSDLAAAWRFVSPHAERNVLVFCVVVVTLFVALFVPLSRRDRLARFFAVGALAAIVPVCSTFPADRLLWFVGIGAMGLVARWIELRPRAWWSAIVAGVLILVHVVLAVPLLAMRSRSMMTVSAPLLRADATLPPSETLQGGTLVFVNPPSDLFCAYILLMRASEGRPLPSTRWLTTGTSDVTITRLDEHALRVRPDGGFIPFVSERMLRRLDHPFTRGQTIHLTGVDIVVDEVEPDGRPAEIVARFERSLDDPSLHWAAWYKRGFIPWTPPPVGARVVLPGTGFLEALFAK